MGEKGVEMSLYGRRCGVQLRVSLTVPSPCSGTDWTSSSFHCRWGLIAFLRCHCRDPLGMWVWGLCQQCGIARNTVRAGGTPGRDDRANRMLSSRAGTARGDQAGGNRGAIPGGGSPPQALHSMGLPRHRAFVSEERLLLRLLAPRPRGREETEHLPRAVREQTWRGAPGHREAASAIATCS